MHPGLILLALACLQLLVPPGSARQLFQASATDGTSTVSPSESPAPAQQTNGTVGTPQPDLVGSNTNGTADTGANATLASPPLTPPPSLPFLPPPPFPSPPHPASVAQKLKDFENKSTAEKAVAITIGVIMILGILTCLVCCVFRRGGQWRIPGMQWFKKKFGAKDKYSRYMDNQDDGF